MPAEPATALVVRGTDWSETSRIVTLFTREFGRVRALAKGGRRVKSNFETAFDLLTVCEVAVIRKAHGGLDLLTEARVAERFPRLRTDLNALYAGYYAAELLADGTQDYDPHPALYDGAISFLRNATSTGATVAAFELVWLRELGYSPRLRGCAACGVAVAPAPRVGFSPAAGGVVCPACLPAATDRRYLTAAGWAALRDLVAGAEVLVVPPEVRQVLGQAVSYVLGRRPKMLGYLDGG